MCMCYVHSCACLCLHWIGREACVCVVYMHTCMSVSAEERQEHVFKEGVRRPGARATCFPAWVLALKEQVPVTTKLSSVFLARSLV